MTEESDWREFKALRDCPTLPPCPFCGIRHTQTGTHPYCTEAMSFRVWRSVRHSQPRNTAMPTTMTVSLNGTDTNPFYKFGLTQNPFPQLARMETDAQVLRLQALGADPIPNTAFIREWLAGYCTEELIDLCVARFKPGELVHFDITWRD
jgi:hypothetical protein